MKEKLNLIFEIGVHNAQSRKEKKKVRLLNILNFSWSIFSLVFIIADGLTLLITNTYLPYLFNIGLHLTDLLIVCFLFYLQKQRKYLVARIGTMILLSIVYMLFANVLEPNKFLEFFLIIIPVLSLLLFDRIWFNILWLLVSFLCFQIPMYIFNWYPSSEINPLTNLIIFVGVFISTNYFKTLNEKNEALLNQEKAEAEKDKALIEIQKIELEQLSSFKNTFFINLSHELRTPLTIIHGFASQISSIDKKQNHFVSVIQDQSKKMTEIVDQILDLSKMKLNKFELNIGDVNLTNLLTKLHASFLPLFKKKEIDFTLNIECPITLKADAIYLERALNNVILNSLKYTERGEVKLSLTCTKSDLTICLNDTGIGIKEEDKDKVFQEFYQVENDVNYAGGSGIGLSFAKNITELHNGSLEIESKWGEGTKVSFKLNTTGIIHEVKQEYISKEYTPIIAPKTKTHSIHRPSILIVEDHKEMMHYLHSLLCDNYTVFNAYNGIEALSIIEKEKIDFIVTDYMMPKMNGAEFIKALRKQGKETPVIVLTARTDIKTKLDVLRMGIDDYLNKPFNTDELLIKIENRLQNFAKTIEEKEEVTLIQTSEFINNLSTFVDKNCHDSTFKLDLICSHFGLSESSLFRKVKAETGLNPMAFIKEVRFLKARKLLETRQIDSSKELSQCIGIKNIAYFKKDYFNRFGSHINDLLNLE